MAGMWVGAFVGNDTIYFLGGPIATPLVKRFQLWRWHMIAVGWSLCVLSLVAASFTNIITTLIATQRVMYGTGFCMLYLPMFATAMCLLILAANNLASVIGQVSFGYLSDRVNNVLILDFVSTMVSSISAFTIWGFARSLEALVIFSIVYGWFAGAFVVLWLKFGSILADDPQPVYNMMALGKGIGNLATGPITAKLITHPVTSGCGMGKFQPLILYLGSFMCVLRLASWAGPLNAARLEEYVKNYNTDYANGYVKDCLEDYVQDFVSL